MKSCRENNIIRGISIIKIITIATQFGKLCDVMNKKFVATLCVKSCDIMSEKFVVTLFVKSCYVMGEKSCGIMRWL